MFQSDIRRFEAAGFRSFPSASTYCDGTWSIRLTEGHPARRLNSVNPLDPLDHARIDQRISEANHRFLALGKSLVFRTTPLAPRQLIEHFQSTGWRCEDESIVMIADLYATQLDTAMDHLPLQDIDLWVSSFIQLSGKPNHLEKQWAEIIRNTRPEVGLFFKEQDALPACALRVVRDYELVGILDVVTNVNMRRRGMAKRLLESALKRAKVNGAKFAWLQVEAANVAATKLYDSMGFDELYRYEYWVPPSENR